MEECVLIKSEQYRVKKVFTGLLIVSIILPLIVYLAANTHLFDYGDRYDSYNETYKIHRFYGSCGDSDKKCYECRMIEDNPSKFGYIVDAMIEHELILVPIAMVVLALISCWVYFWLRSYELTVTDKRVYGKVAFGKRVDLPVDSVSAIATISLLKGVSVSTSSGRISFLAIKSADEIYTVMNNLLIERQQKRVEAPVTASASKAAPVVQQSSAADELKKFKELLDMGIITQEEFDAKKKQLLGL